MAAASPSKRQIHQRLAEENMANGTSSSASCIRVQASGRVAATRAVSPDWQCRLKALERIHPVPDPARRRRVAFGVKPEDDVRGDRAPSGQALCRLDLCFPASPVG